MVSGLGEGLVLPADRPRPEHDLVSSSAELDHLAAHQLEVDRGHAPDHRFDGTSMRCPVGDFGRVRRRTLTVPPVATACAWRASHVALPPFSLVAMRRLLIRFICGVAKHDPATVQVPPEVLRASAYRAEVAASEPR